MAFGLSKASQRIHAITISLYIVIGVKVSYQIQKLNHTHDAIMRWLVLNPGRTQGECAVELGMTQAWLSQVINSDMFQAEYRRRCAEAGVADTFAMQSRLGVIGAKALAEIEARLDGGEASERFLTDTAKMTLESLGYGSPAQASASAPVALVVNATIINEARERAAQQHTIELNPQ